jgi:hypothetical protein
MQLSAHNISGDSVTFRTSWRMRWSNAFRLQKCYFLIVSKGDLCRLAYQFAGANTVLHRFDKGTSGNILSVRRHSKVSFLVEAT